MFQHQVRCEQDPFCTSRQLGLQAHHRSFVTKLHRQNHASINRHALKRPHVNRSEPPFYTTSMSRASTALQFSRLRQIHTLPNRKRSKTSQKHAESSLNLQRQRPQAREYRPSTVHVTSSRNVSTQWQIIEQPKTTPKHPRQRSRSPQ